MSFGDETFPPEFPEYPEPIDVGGNPSDLQCCQDRVCDCVPQALEGIEEALKEINYTLQEMIKKPCDTIDECIDEIIRKIDEHYRSSQATCDECKQMLAAGMGGTIEFAVQCAFVECEKAKHECSPGDPESWDQPCSQCGEVDCCCDEGICEPGPCEEEQQKKPDKFQGWCDYVTGLYYATKAGADPPSATATPVSIADTEEVALQEARETCRSLQSPPEPPIIITPPYPFPLCDLQSFLSSQALNDLSASGAGVNVIAGYSQAVTAALSFGLEGVNPNIVGQVLSGLTSFFTGLPPTLINTLGAQIASLVGCDSSSFVSLIQTLGGFGMVSKATGIDLSPFSVPYQYAAFSACRNQHMSVDQALQAYLANQIDRQSLEALFAIRGICPGEPEKILQSARAKPIPHELGIMRLRGLINETEYNRSMRELGYLEQRVVDNEFALFQQLPTLSDIIRLMVRDADDERDDGPVKRFNLDALFDAKYGKQLRQWSEQQGVPELFARYAWRAHWQIPSPTQLFTFWHRLRKNPNYPTLRTEIEQALIQQDVLPFWHQYYFDTGFIPLGRVDIRRAFNIGTLQESDLDQAYGALGYSDDNIDRLIKFSKRLRRDALLSHRVIKLWQRFIIDRQEAANRLAADSYTLDEIDFAFKNSEQAFITSPFSTAFTRGDLPRGKFIDRLQLQGVSADGASRIADLLASKITHHPSIKDYAVGLIDRDDADNQMREYGMDSDVIEMLLRQADQAVEHSFVINCQRGIKRRFLMGEIEKQQAVNELMIRKTTMARANRLVDWWDCERGSYGRAITASRLCEWLSRGIITGDDFIKRLQRLGYSEIDSGRILNDCLISTNLKLLAQAKKDAKEQAAADRRAANALIRANKAAIAQSARNTRLANQRAATINRRQRSLMTAAERVAKKCDCATFDAYSSVKNEHRRIMETYGLTVDESITVVGQASEAWDGGDIATFSQTVDSLAALSADSSLTPSIDPLSGVEITNGSIQPSA